MFGLSGDNVKKSLYTALNTATVLHAVDLKV
jgi:hypothetical protein